MPSGKDRLYVALYARGGQPKMSTLEDTYHWALIIGPKEETSMSRGWRFHAKEDVGAEGTIGWRFDEKGIRLVATQMLLARIRVGKISNNARVTGILRSIPIRQDVQGWNCVYWVMEALQRLKEDKNAMGTSVLEWKDVRGAAMTYIQKKKEEHRFDGRGNFDMTKAATFDMMLGRETMP